MRLTVKLIGKFILVISCTVHLSCRNALDETAEKNTPEAVYYDVQLRMNARDYSGAIALLQSLGPTFLAQRSVSLVYASAYSGRCGLDFVSFADDIQGVADADSIFSYLMASQTESTDLRIADCVVAEGIIKGFGTESERLADENVLMGLSSLTKIGNVLNRYADTDSDGAADAGFDHCDTTDFPDAAVREVGSGIALTLLSIAAVGDGLTDAALEEIRAMCALHAELNVFCTTTDKNAFTSTQVQVLRSLMGTTESGVGSCPGGLAACICP